MVWTEITRRHYRREGLRYESDTTDAEWFVMEPLLPEASALGRPRATDLRTVMNAILYIASTGCQWSYRQFLVTAGGSGGGGYGLKVSRFGEDLDPVVERYTENEFWQLVVAIETTPAFVGAFEQFEDHGERGAVGQASLRSDRAVPYGSEGAFNGIGGPQVFPVLGREVVERQ